MDSVPAQSGAPPQEQSELSLLSNEMVGLYKHLFGRGPTRVKTSYADENLIVSTLEDSLTPAERSMARMGEHQRLEETRLFFQQASRGDFIRTVEGITGRKVRAFVSGMDSEKDVAAELFYLEPAELH